MNVAHQKVMYRDRSNVVELLLQLENKQQIMQNNVQTQHKHMYSLYNGSLCNIAFPIAHFTFIVASVIHENLNAMKNCIEFCLSYIYEQSSVLSICNVIATSKKSGDTDHCRKKMIKSTYLIR